VTIKKGIIFEKQLHTVIKKQVTDHFIQQGEAGAVESCFSMETTSVRILLILARKLEFTQKLRSLFTETFHFLLFFFTCSGNQQTPSLPLITMSVFLYEAMPNYPNGVLRHN